MISSFLLPRPARARSARVARWAPIPARLAAPSPVGRSLVGLSLVGLALAAAPARAQSPDATFGTSGVVATPVGTTSAAQRVLVQPDNRIVLVGVSGSATTSDIALTRYLSNGDLDLSFGGGDGIATADLSGVDVATSAARLPDGAFLVAGTTDDGVGFALARFTAAGELDLSFGGGDGWMTVPIGTVYDEPTDVLAHPGGGFVVVGYTAVDAGFANLDWVVARFDASGAPVASFGGGDGIATLDVGGAADLAFGAALQGDGSLVVAGSAIFAGTTPFTVARFDANGDLDLAFGGGDGIAMLDVADATFDQAHAFDVALQADGAIVVGGQVRTPGGDPSIALARFTAAGDPDLTFGGTDGWASVDLAARPCAGEACEQANAVAVQADGKIVVGGFVSTTATDYEHAVATFLADGTLDPSFGTAGVYRRDATGGVLTDVVLQPNNKLLAAGSDASSFSVSRFETGQALPVELVSFTAALDGRTARLAWWTASESDNAGFDVETRAGSEPLWRVLGTVAGGGTRTERADYAFTTPALAPGTHRFRLRQRDLDGTTTLSPVVEVAVATTELRIAREGARLRLWVPEGQKAEVFDATGRRLLSGLESGTLDPQTFASGIYFVRAGGRTLSFPVIH